MSTRSYGYRYDELGEQAHSLTEIAKRMRADVKLAVSEGLLPGSPVKYGVRVRDHSIDITVQGWPGPFYSHERGECGRPVCPQPDCLTPEVEAAKMTLDRIHDAYNYDGSDIQSDYFDVNYYGSVSFEDPETARWRAEQKAKQTARRAAIDARAKRPGRDFTKRGGVVHWIVENDKGRMFLACSGRAAGFGMVYDDKAEPTCSRCRKQSV